MTNGEEVKMDMCKKILSFMMVTVMLVALATPIFAVRDNAAPYYNNTATTQNTFVIDETGLAGVNFTIRGYRGITTKIVVDTKIERQSGSSWVQVTNASWTDESTLYYCSCEHEIQLTQRGTYKATFTYTVSGSGGAADVITRELQYTY